jgi:hypothetical protein
MSNDGTIDTGDATDDGDISGSGVVKRLGKIERILTRANNRLVSIAGATPPDDNHPAILASLANIVTLSNQTIATADEIKVKVDAGGTGIGDNPG